MLDMNTLELRSTTLPNFTINKLLFYFRMVVSLVAIIMVVSVFLCLPVILFLLTKTGA